MYESYCTKILYFLAFSDFLFDMGSIISVVSRSYSEYSLNYSVSFNVLGKDVIYIFCTVFVISDLSNILINNG